MPGTRSIPSAAQWRRPRIALAVAAGLFLAAGRLAAQDGTITGRVTSSVTGSPVAGALVEVAGAVSAASDAAGSFRLSGVPLGIREIVVRAIGYAPATVTNVVVGSGKATVLGITLSPMPVMLTPLEITPGYYPPVTAANATPQLLQGEEIRRAPGVQEDVIRAVAVLPGVGVQTPGRNDLIVRGGAPFENLFVVDGIEVPNLNHFGSQGSSGGPLSLVNVDFVEEASFAAGWYPVRFGDRTAGITDIRLREGSQAEHSGELNVSATGAGFMFEGPLGPRSSFWAGVRRSYLDLLFKAAGFSFVPTYWDGQVRLVSRPGDRDIVSTFWVGALDGVTLYNDDADARYDNSRLVVPEQRQYAGGLSWRRGIGEGALTTTLGRSFVRYVTSQSDSLVNETFSNRSREGETSLRVEWQGPLSQRLGLVLGGVSRRAGTLDYQVRLDGRYRTDAAGVPRPLAVDTAFSAWRHALYGEITAALGSWGSVTGGLRADHYGFATPATHLSPRLQLRLGAGRSGLTVSAARLVQPPQYIWLIGDPANPGRLAPIVADQAAFGVETRPRDDTRVRFESYYKRYRRYAARPYRPQAVLAPSGFEDITNDIPFGLEPIVSTGRGRAWGAELLVQRKPARGPFYGLLSATLAWTRFQGVDGIERPGAFDARVLGTALAGYRAGAWELTARFRIATGTPTTPFTTAGPEAGRLDFTRYQAGPRLPVFHALDVRVDRRWSLRGVQIETYLDVQNAYGRKNVSQYRWEARTGAVAADASLGLLPSVGVNIEF